MKKLLIIFSVLFALLLREECHGQGTVKYTAGISYGYGDPTYTPNGNVSKKYINLTTLRSSTYSGTAWVLDGRGIDVVSGCAAPAYTPGPGQSNIVINNCTLLQNGQGPELYVFDGTSWIFINEKNTAPTYTAGTGIDITGTVISNTGDLSNTNEIQNLSLSGQTLGISTGNTVTLPVVAVAAGTGISVSNSSGTATVTNTAPDQAVSITGAGVNAVTGTYPNFTVTGTEVDGSVTNELQTLSVAGSNLSISGGNTVTLPTPSSTLDDLTDVTITSPANNQILQYNSSGSQWVNATLSAITGSGTANYIPKWSGSGTQSNSGLYDTGSAIGYGTTTPSAIFDITQSPVVATFLANYWLKNNNTNWNGVSYKWSNSDETNQFGLNIGAFNSSGNKIIRFQTFGSPTAVQWDFNTDDRLNILYRTIFNRGITGAFHSDLELRINSHTNGGSSKGVRFTYAGGGFGVAGTLMSVLETGNVLIGTTAETGAKLDVTSTTGGILFPRMTSTQRDAIASPPDGLVVYNTTAAKLQVRAASTWVDLH